MLLNPTDQSAPIAAIDPDEAQFLTPATQSMEDEACAVTLLHRGGRDHDQQQQAERVHQQMALAPLNLFSCVIAADAFNFSGLDALRVQTPGGRMLVSPALLTHLCTHSVVETLPVAAQAPPPKVVIDTLPTRVFARQHPPLDTTDHDIEDGVNNHSHVQRTRASTKFRRWNQLFDKMPLAVSQIGRVDLVRHTQNLLDRAGWQSTSQTASKQLSRHERDLQKN